MSRSVIAIAAALVWMGLCVSAQSAGPGSCTGLRNLVLEGVKIKAAEVVPAGGYSPALTPEGGNVAAAVFKALPAFCRVQAVATPTADSNIRIEVWLPVSGWNGRFQGVGNGGFAGYINDFEMALALGKGYAAGNTDTGHTGSAIDSAWALGHPEQVTDFGHRGVHEMTRVSKAVVKAYFGKKEFKAYFDGCSNGGRQALMEAQRYPDDYDGIISGAPANYWTHLVTGSIWDARATTVPPEAYIPTRKVAAIASAVNAACDDGDGVKDSVLNDPRNCKFRPATMSCREGDSDSCLTQPQVLAVEKLYGGARNSNGKQVFPGFLPGAEDGSGGWGLWITGMGPGKALLFAFGKGFFANMVYNKPDWDYRAGDFDALVKDADAHLSGVLNATDPNLERFTAHGGKLLLYHGWNDPAISALNTIDYFDSVKSVLGVKKADDSIRLFMAPGMQHCAGGTGPDSFGQAGTRGLNDPEHNAQLALERWVEKGIAPSRIIAAKYANEAETAPKTTRPLCAYPKSAKYKGTGSTDDAANFSCD